MSQIEPYTIKPGEYMMDALEEMRPRHPGIGEIRGKGLLIGVEFTHGAEKRHTAAPEVRHALIHNAFDRGLLLLGRGICTLLVIPALNITKDIADEALMIMDAALTDAERKHGMVR